MPNYYDPERTAIRRQAMRDHPFVPAERDPQYCGHWSGGSRTSEFGTLVFRAQCGYPPDMHPANVPPPALLGV